LIAHVEQRLGGFLDQDEGYVAPHASAPVPGSRLASKQWSQAHGLEPALPVLGAVRAFRPPQHISPKNAAALAFLDSWLREPDDKGDEWWSSFERELEENHTFKERDIG
jgi:hypothetical protein